MFPRSMFASMTETAVRLMGRTVAPGQKDSPASGQNKRGGGALYIVDKVQ